MATKFITVSIEIMHDKNLTPNQKFILAEIEQLCSLEKGCIASNRHFAELIGIKVQGVSNAINDLAKKGYINIDNSKTIRNYGRIITIHENVSTIHENVSPLHCNVESKGNKTINKTINKEYIENSETNPTSKSTTKDTLFNTWNEVATKFNLTNIKVITKSRLSKINSREKDVKDFTDTFTIACEKIGKSEYLKGSRGWKVTFDWLIENDSNIMKVVEGNYDDNKPTPKPSNLDIGKKEYKGGKF